MRRVEARADFSSPAGCARCGAPLAPPSAGRCVDRGKSFCKDHLRTDNVGHGKSPRLVSVCGGCLSRGKWAALLVYVVAAAFVLALVFGLPALLRYLNGR